ncbi:hypothetical protein KAW65_08600 [candidate division WOR-3 bacterium]|nr:hypothetical protein [candidate division WOR-3 bacterium]
MKILTKFDIPLNSERIQRCIGYPKASPKILSIIDKEIQNAKLFIKPIAIYKLINPLTHPVFKGASRVAFAICTIGEKLEQESTSLLNKGELLRGFILDAIGSYAAEKLAGYVNKRILQEIEEMEFRASSRFSPGYGLWTLEGQKLVFKVLDGKKIGVELLPSLMMKPRKSVSFALNLYKK